MKNTVSVEGGVTLEEQHSILRDIDGFVVGNPVGALNEIPVSGGSPGRFFCRALDPPGFFNRVRISVDNRFPYDLLYLQKGEGKAVPGRLGYRIRGKAE